MNYQPIRKLFLGLLIIPVSVFSQAPEAPSIGAEITSEFCVSLSAEEAIVEYYEIDISHFGFETEKEANDRFGFICNNLLTYTVDFDNMTCSLHVHLDRTPELKDVVWWNEYLSSLCSA